MNTKNYTFIFLFLILNLQIFCQEPLGILVQFKTLNYNKQTVPLSQIISDYNITYFEKAFPGKSIEEINKYEYIKSNHDLYILKQILISTGLFVSVEVETSYPVAQNCGKCLNEIEVTEPSNTLSQHYENMNIPCAWGHTYGDKSVNIAIMDQFFDNAHPDLNLSSINNDFMTVGNPQDCNHGFGIASGINGVKNGFCIEGTCSGCSLNGYSIGMTCTHNSMIDFESGNANGGPAWQAHIDGNRALNISYASTNIAPAVINEILSPRGGGVATSIITAAHGAGHSNIANIPGVINVGHLNADLSYIVYDDNFIVDQNIDILASCRTCSRANRLNANEGLCSVGAGNSSLGAGFVTGIVGLMYSVNNCLTPAQVEGLIKETATKLASNADDPGDEFYGILTAKLIDAEAAVRGAKGEFDPITNGEVRIWEQDHYLACDLYIEDESTLIIDGVNVFIEEGVRIIVGEGSELIIRGVQTNDGLVEAVLTNTTEYCLGQPDKMWGGIQVWGGGTVKISNSNLEHSNIGVKLWHDAIITATSTEFNNNRKAVEFIGEGYRNFSKFIKCDFVVDENFLKPSLDAHISMWAVEGINIEGCKFSNYISNEDPYTTRGDGIKSLDANFTVKEHFKGENFENVRSKFERLNNGIDASNSSSIRTFVVERTDFHENKKGVLSSCVDGLTIKESEFVIGSYEENLNLSDEFEGLKMIKCSGYNIIQNDFLKCRSSVGIITPEGTEYTYCDNLGTNIIDSGEEPNSILGNYFEILERGNRAYGQNRSSFLQDQGLQYLCNEFESNEIDIVVSLDKFSTDEQGIAMDQGKAVPPTPAGNCFGGSNTNLLNEVLPFINYYHTELQCKGPQFISGVTPHVLLDQEDECKLIPNNPDEPDNPEPPNPCPGFEINCLSSRMNSILDQRNLLLSNYNSLIDGGDTDNLVQMILNANPQEVLASIQGISPYLSKSAALEIFKLKEIKYSESDIVNIIEYNPELMLSNVIYRKIFEEENLSSHSINLINNVIGQTTERTLALRALAAIENEIIELRRIVVNKLLISEEVNHDEIDFWLSLDKRYRNEVKRIQQLFVQKKYNEAESLMSSINVNDYAEGPTSIEWQSFIELKEIEKQANSEYSYYVNLDVSIKEDLINKAVNFKGYSGLHSANILNYFFNEDYRHYDTSQDVPTLFRKEKDMTLENHEILIFPNPAYPPNAHRVRFSTIHNYLCLDTEVTS